MAADRATGLARVLRREAGARAREVALDGASTPISGLQSGAVVTVAEEFTTGYNTGTGLTTVPFRSDVSLEGSDHIVTG